MSKEEMDTRMAELRAEARGDMVDAIPKVFPKAQGIWMLARV